MQEPPISLVLGLPFHSISMDQAILDCKSIVEAKQPEYIVTANLDFVTQAYNDDDLRNILFYAKRVLCDGMPLVWLSKLFGVILPERVPGSDMVYRIFELSNEESYRIYMLGSDDATLEKTKSILESRYENLTIAGYMSPPIGDIHSWDNTSISNEIKNSESNILLVALGCPKQERWINEHYRNIGVPLSIGIGASLDFIAGKQVRAPAILQKIGMEWFWRLMTNPKRLFARYFEDAKHLCHLSRIQMKLQKSREQAPRAKPRTPWKIDDAEIVNLSGSIEVDTLKNFPRPNKFDHHIICDCSEVTFMDSSGLGFLAGLARDCHNSGRCFCLLNPTEAIESFLKSMHLERQLPSFHSKGDIEEYICERSERFVVLKKDHILRRVVGQPLFDLEGDRAIALESSILHSLSSIQGSYTIIIDLSEVGFMDSFAIGSLIRLQKECRDRNHDMRLENPQESVRNLLRLLHLEKTLIDA